MLLLRAKYLEARELPASDPYPPSTLVSVLAGTDTLHLIARQGVQMTWRTPSSSRT